MFRKTIVPKPDPLVEAIRDMALTDATQDDADRLRNALPELIAALEVVDLMRDEDWLAERIGDTLDVDWRPIDAARAIIAALPKETDNG